MRERIQTEYVNNFGYWMQWLTGYDGFQYDHVNFNVVGWAVRDEKLLLGPRETFDVYTNFTDNQGLPTCRPWMFSWQASRR